MHKPRKDEGEKPIKQESEERIWGLKLWCFLLNTFNTIQCRLSNGLTYDTVTVGSDGSVMTVASVDIPTVGASASITVAVVSAVIV